MLCSSYGSFFFLTIFLLLIVDPHPGNIFIGEGGKVSLIDCGQFKALPRPQRVQLAELVLAVASYQEASSESVKENSKKQLANLVRNFGVQLTQGEEENDDLACSVALFLFGDEETELPGGFSKNELDDNSPIKLVASFPQELVLLGRATVLLKGIAKKLEVPFSLASKWAPGCALALNSASEPVLPIWGKDMSSSVAPDGDDGVPEKIRIRQVGRLLKQWGKGKGERLLERSVKRLPPALKAKVLQAELARRERK